MSTDVPALSTGVKLNFGIGQIAEGIKNGSFGTFLMFYYNQVLGVPADLAGLAIALALIFDAVTDPVAGSVSDRWQGGGGRRHPFMYASALPLGVSFVLLFAPLVSIESVGNSGMFAWMLICTVLTRAAMTLYHVPHMALGAELSQDYDERTILVALRHTFGAIGLMMVYVLGFGVFFAPSADFPNGQTDPSAYPPFAMWLGLIMTITIFMTAYGTRSRIPYLPKARETEEKIGIKDVLGEAYEAMKNDSFRWMMFGFILVIVAFGIAGATGLYMFTFFWALSSFQILAVLIMLPIGMTLGYAVSGRFFAWLDKRDAMIAGGVLWMFFHAVPVLVYLAGWAPEPGTWAMALFLATIIVFAGASVAQVIVGIGTGMADIADENELATGRRQEGVFFGASAFANKCSAALGSFFAGIFLEWINWPVGSEVRTAADIPADTLLQLAVVSGPVVSLLAIPGILCLRGYKLNRGRLVEIQNELQANASVASES
jgi:GPH family glycoside/pentoside/hexuronide:cation symporter